MPACAATDIHACGRQIRTLHSRTPHPKQPSCETKGHIALARSPAHALKTSAPWPARAPHVPRRPLFRIGPRTHPARHPPQACASLVRNRSGKRAAHFCPCGCNLCGFPPNFVFPGPNMKRDAFSNENQHRPDLVELNLAEHGPNVDEVGPVSHELGEFWLRCRQIRWTCNLGPESAHFGSMLAKAGPKPIRFGALFTELGQCWPGIGHVWAEIDQILGAHIPAPPQPVRPTSADLGPNSANGVTCCIQLGQSCFEVDRIWRLGVG